MTLLSLYKTAMKAYGPQCLVPCSSINACSHAPSSFSENKKRFAFYVLSRAP